jgi:lysophospholipase L1-like esterase
LETFDSETIGAERRIAASEQDKQPQFLQNSNFLPVAYLFQLVVPALLLLDIVTAWWRGRVPFELRTADSFIAGLSATWLVAAIAALVLVRDRRRFFQRVQKPLLAICAICMMLFFIEVVAQAALRFPAPIAGLNTPGHNMIGPYDPTLYPGVHGMKSFTINRLELRGSMPPKERERAYRVIAIGGSTTLCPALADNETWPDVLTQEIDASQSGHRMWVGNAGVNGKNTVDHLVVLQWLPGTVKADMWIFLVGVNDLSPTLAYQGGPTQAVFEKAAGYQGELPAGTLWRSWYPYYRRLQLFRMIRGAVLPLQQRFFPRNIDRPFRITPLRAARAAAPVVPLPDLHIGLEEYRGRLLALAARCKTIQVRCLFVTQPSLWRSDLSPAEKELLWLGWVGSVDKPKGFVSPGDLAHAMDAYNRVLLEVCQENGLECFDLASRVPKETSAFYDDVHFNEAGARLVAQSLKQYLLSRPPFATTVVPSVSGGTMPQ